MALRGSPRTVADYHSTVTKVTPAREWQQPEKFPRRSTEIDDGLSSFGRVAKATLISLAALLTASPQHSDGNLKNPNDRHHS